jgi:hypothetical protein
MPPSVKDDSTNTAGRSKIGFNDGRPCGMLPTRCEKQHWQRD